MSGVHKEDPVVEETITAPATASVEESPAASATPTQATSPEAVKDAATSATTTVSDKTPKIFGAFTTETPKKDDAKETTTSSTSTPVKPLFGGFTTGTMSASAWSAPSTLGGFGSASSFTPQKVEDKEEVAPWGILIVN
jgi:hypothetical protein